MVALSGGPDSCALLLALAEAAESGLLPRPVGAAHFHHGLRGRDADGDAAFSAALCARLGLPCVVGIGAVAAGVGLSPNDAARRARYAFLQEAARDRNADTIATAHHADDQAETVLLRVLRGTGTDGLAGIPATRVLTDDLTVVRPLLFARRAAIEEYCREKGITPRRDPSNERERYARARIRARLPDLAHDFNPRLSEALIRLADNAARDADLLKTLTEEMWQRAQAGEVGKHCACLQVTVLRDAHPALRRRVLLRALRHVSGESAAAAEAGSDSFVTLLDGWLNAKKTTAADLPGGIIAQTDTQTLTLSRPETAGASAQPYNVSLVVPGVTEIPPIALRVEAALWEPNSGAEINRARYSPVIDMDASDPALLGYLCVRQARHGDRIAPLGMGGKTRLVHDILAEAGVPEPERSTAPLVFRADTGELLWLIGRVQAESTRVLAESARVLRLAARK